MQLTSQMIKDKAQELGIDCLAIGSIDRYRDAPPLMNPVNYFPECRSVIMLAMGGRGAFARNDADVWQPIQGR